MAESRTRRIVRRLAIALALSAIVLCVAHWYVKRGVDERLVGTWSVTMPQRTDVVWSLGPYGGAAAYFQGTGKRILVRYSWQAHGTTVEFSSFNDRRTFSTRFRRDCEILWNKLT